MKLLITELSFRNTDDEVEEAASACIELNDNDSALIERQIDGELLEGEFEQVDTLILTKFRNLLKPHGIIIEEDSRIFDSYEGGWSIPATGNSGFDGFVVVIAEN